MPIPISPDTGLATTTIDERTYEFELWGAQSSLETLCDIAGALGKPLVQLLALQSNDPEAKLGDVLGPQAGLAGIEQIAEHLIAQVVGDNQPRTLGIIRKLTSHGVFCDGKKIAFDSHYANKLAHLFRVLQSAVEAQYGDFFAALAPLAGLRRTTPAQA